MRATAGWFLISAAYLIAVPGALPWALLPWVFYAGLRLGDAVGRATIERERRWALHPDEAEFWGGGR